MNVDHINVLTRKMTQFPNIEAISQGIMEIVSFIFVGNLSHKVSIFKYPVDQKITLLYFISVFILLINFKTKPQEFQ